MKFIMRVQSLLAVPLFAMLLTMPGVASVEAAVQLDRAAAAKPQTTIQSVQVVGDEMTAEVLVTTSTPVVYTSYKAAAPTRLVVDFTQAVPADGLSPEVVGKAAIRSATIKRYDTEAGTLTRLELYLAQELDPVVVPMPGKQNVLRISFPGYKPVAAPVEAAPSAEQQAAYNPAEQNVAVMAKDAVVTSISGAGNAVQIDVDGAVADVKTFRLTKPERIVVDLMGVKAVPSLKIVQVNTAGISTARVGSYNDKTRIVLDAVSGGLPDATVVKNAAGVAVAFAASPQNMPEAAPAPFTNDDRAASAAIKTRIEAIDFQAFEKLSRVSVKMSGPFTVEQPTKSEGFVTFKVHNALLPRHLQRSYEAREFTSPVLRITPIQIRSSKGEDTIIRIAMRADAGYSLRKEADMVYLDFEHPADLVVESTSGARKAAALTQPAAAPAAVEQQLVQSQAPTGKRTYVGRKVTLEFADAEVRKIFQLLSEVSNKNFVLGDEVTGAISLKLVNVPWDQALDIILDTKGLDKREEGNIILIRGKGKFKSLLDEEQEIRKAALKSEPLETRMFDVNYADIAGIVTQFTALKTDRGVITSDARTNKVIVKDVKTALDDMAMLLKNLDVPEKQVMIEARIIEASTSFTKSLGIHWGLYTDPNIGGGLGINNLQTSFGGLTSTDPMTSDGFTQVPGAFTDIAFGTIGANVKLNMRLNAAATAGLVKIISTPKVATLNHKTAKITQGQQIPYTSATSDKIETKFVEAALSLEVTPHINANGTIVLKIDAKNDAPDRQTSVGTPPINKKQATTEMLLRDGETTVIGGIYVDRDTEGADGVPWLMDIPFIGHLFKSTNTEKSKSELLIFITPRILSMT